MSRTDGADAGGSLVAGDWTYVKTLLPERLDESAQRLGALQRRRGVNSASALLRLLLAYSVGDLSLKDVAAWGKGLKISTLSTEALFYRVRGAEAWLAELLAEQLSAGLTPVRSGHRLRIVDATVITGPASTGTDWRLHVLWDPQGARIAGITLDDDKVGENYGLHELGAGDVVIGDSGYAFSRSIDAAIQAHADVVVRITPATLRLGSADKTAYNLQAQAASVPPTGAKVWELLLPVAPEKTKSRKSWRLSDALRWHPVRIVAARTRSGEAIWVLTTLAEDQASAAEVLQLYRLRWQIELAFKRLKSLAWLDSLPTMKGPTARSWILGRLLMAVLAQRLADPQGSLSPWGYALR
jgi:hypothetical protein